MFTNKTIRAIRKKLGLNTTRFAALLGVTENCVMRWEMGDRYPRIQYLSKMDRLRKKHGWNWEELGEKAQ